MYIVKYKYHVEMPPRSKEYSTFIKDSLQMKKIEEFKTGKIKLLLSPIIQSIEETLLLPIVDFDVTNETQKRALFKNHFPTLYSRNKNLYSFFMTNGDGLHMFGNFLINITNMPISEVKSKLISGYSSYPFIDFSIIKDTPFTIFGYDEKTNKTAFKIEEPNDILIENVGLLKSKLTTNNIRNWLNNLINVSDIYSIGDINKWRLR